MSDRIFGLTYILAYLALLIVTALVCDYLGRKRRRREYDALRLGRQQSLRWVRRVGRDW